MACPHSIVRGGGGGVNKGGGGRGFRPLDLIFLARYEGERALRPLS